ncbi:hypothetical protein COT87_00775, partial [Candidatus Collierbacteria bacterium CG10_big_fil_rev_8_21_14_0_10_44_9]
DATVKIAKKFSRLLPLTIINSPKRHVCTQRNLGTKAAKADVFIFSDADNRLPPYFLQGIKYRWESENVDILSPFITPDIQTPQNNTISTTLNLFLDLQMSLKPRFLLESCIIVNKDCFNTIHGFDETVSYSEGTIFLETAIVHNFRAKIIKDPTYSLSFRRLKKYGTAKFISGAVGIQLMDLLGIDQKRIKLNKLYPMLGGSVYDSRYKINKTKIAKFLKNITEILKDF